MRKNHINEIRRAWRFANLSIEDSFWVEWESIYAIRADSKVSPVKQCRIRAKNLALVLTISLLDLQDLIAKMDK